MSDEPIDTMKMKATLSRQRPYREPKVAAPEFVRYRVGKRELEEPADVYSVIVSDRYRSRVRWPFWRLRLSWWFLRLIWSGRPR